MTDLYPNCELNMNTGTMQLVVITYENLTGQKYLALQIEQRTYENTCQQNKTMSIIYNIHN